MIDRTEYNKSYYARNKDKLKENAKNYYNNNQEKVLEDVKKYRDSNRLKIQEKGRKYYRRKLENRLLNGARARAKKYGYDFNIDITDIVIPEFCPLLGIKISVAEGRKTSKANSASIDRIDSRKGYVKGNVWIISHRANTMKSDACLEEFKIMVKNWERLACNLLYSAETGRMMEMDEESL